MQEKETKTSRTAPINRFECCKTPNVTGGKKTAASRRDSSVGRQALQYGSKTNGNKLPGTPNAFKTAGMFGWLVGWLAG